MKKYLIAAATLLAISTSSVVAQAQQAYGKAFKAESVQSPEELVRKMDKATKLENVVVKAPIAQVCQAEGCWLKLKNAAGEDMLVKFKDHAFLVPKDLSGTATVYGTATKKTISVADQRHMAEDAGKTPEEIAAINSPRVEIRIESTGIVVE